MAYNPYFGPGGVGGGEQSSYGAPFQAPRPLSPLQEKRRTARIVIYILLGCMILISGCMVVGYYAVQDIGKVIGNSLNAMLKNLNVPADPSLYGMNMVFSPHGTKAYVTVPSRDALDALDTQTGAILARIPVGQTPTGLALSPNGGQVWVVDTAVPSILKSVTSGAVPANGTVSVVSTFTRKVVRTIPVGIGPIDVAFSPGGATAYVTVNGVLGSGYVSVIDTSTFRTLANIVPSLASTQVASSASKPLSASATEASCPSGVPDYCWNPTSVAVTPTGKEIWVSEASTVAGRSPIMSLEPRAAPYPDYVYVFSAGNYKQLASIRVGNGPYFMAMSRDGRYVYIADKVGCELNEISTATFSVTATVHTPPSDGCPFGVAASTIDSVAYTVTGNDRTVNAGRKGKQLEVVNFATGNVNAFSGAGTDPVTVSVSPSGNTIYVVDAKAPTIVGLSAVSYRVVSVFYVHNQPMPSVPRATSRPGNSAHTRWQPATKLSV
ncbi:MAG: hypothetical protein ACYDGY_07955 [Acidimicrobiales bacterium]